MRLSPPASLRNPYWNFNKEHSMLILIKLKRAAILQKLFAFKGHITIKRSPKTYLRQQGWSLTNWGINPEWQGYYRTRYGSFKGRVVASSASPLFYVYKPPEKLRCHKHWSCFTDQTNGWYSIHFRRMPKDVDSGVMEIERIICESMNLKPVKTN